MNHSPFWTADESAIVRRMDAAGATANEIAEALPGRSKLAVMKQRRLVTGKRPRRGKTTGSAPLQQRIAALDATVAAAMAERKPDWDLVDVLLSGLEYLRWKATQRQNTTPDTVPSLRSQHSASQGQVRDDAIEELQ